MNDLKEISTLLTVVAVALMRDDDAVLMQRRRLSTAHGGLWEFPGGKVEAGESPETAAVREIAEELGVVLCESALCPVSFASGSAGSGLQPLRPLVILLYTCRSWAGVPQCHDGEEIAWCDPRAVPALSMPPLDYPLSQALIKALARPGQNNPS